MPELTQEMKFILGLVDLILGTAISGIFVILLTSVAFHAIGVLFLVGSLALAYSGFILMKDNVA